MFSSISWPHACLPTGDVSIGIKCAPGVVGPAEADIDFDIIKNDNDTFTVKYTPPGAGRYTIMVLFANQVPTLSSWQSPVAYTTAPKSVLAAGDAVIVGGGTIPRPSIEHFLCVGNVPQRKQRGLFQRLSLPTLTKLFLHVGDPRQPLPHQSGPVSRCQQSQG